MRSPFVVLGLAFGMTSISGLAAAIPVSEYHFEVSRASEVKALSLRCILNRCLQP
jgi:hypothetical protein